MQIYNEIKQVQKEKLIDSYYIYAVENDIHNVKVGISQDITQRLESLSGSNGGGHKLIRCAVSKPTYLRTLEGIIHSQFDNYRVQGTEWFIGISLESVVNYINALFLRSDYKRCNLERKKAGGYRTKRAKEAVVK